MDFTRRILFWPLIDLLCFLFAVLAAPIPTHCEVRDAALWNIELGGGELLRPDGFDLTKPGAEWKDQPGARIRYVKDGSPFPSYRLELDNPPPSEIHSEGASSMIFRELWSKGGFPVKGNRHYRVSTLVRADFPRNTMEINLSLRFFDAEGNRTGYRQLLGLPSKTDGPDGWQRLEWTVTAPEDASIHEGRASFFLGWTHFEKDPIIEFADLVFIEMPVKPLHPSARGEGVTFPGSVGSLPMKVESADEKSGVITVETTGARYEFRTADDTILASQRIEFPRNLAKWQTSVPLAGLRIDRQSDDVCVLSNENLTIGVQADSMVVFNPHQELEMTLTNLLGGDFNRYARGHLYSTDDFGGITVNPYCPPGTGRTARSTLITKGLSFSGFADQDFDSTGPADPGWQARWITLPGELFCTSVFPPRPYPWEQSFRSGWKLIRHGSDLTAFDNRTPYMDTWLLWDYIPKTWGHSYSDEYQPWDEDEMHAVVKKIHDQGDRVIPFMSAYWTPTRDADVYIDGVRDFAQKYGIDGIYSDGLPAEDWMLAYREMRMLRALFPDGPIVVHDSFPQSKLAISEFKPFLYTYATFSYMAENAATQKGENWQYPRYITSMYRKANNLGITKGDKWQDAAGERMSERGTLVDMVYNGRDHVGFYRNRYYAALSKLEELWKEKGDEPHFYDRYYLPKAQELAGLRIGRTAMPIETREPQGDKVRVTLQSLTPGSVIHYTTDGTVPSEQDPQYRQSLDLEIPAAQSLRYRAFAEGLDPSAMPTLP